MPINEEATEKNEHLNAQNPLKNDFKFTRLRLTSEEGQQHRKGSAELSLLDIGKQAINWDKSSKSGGNNSSVDEDEFSRANSLKTTHGAKFVFFIMSVLAIAQMM